MIQNLLHETVNSSNRFNTVRIVYPSRPNIISPINTSPQFYSALWFTSMKFVMSHRRPSGKSTLHILNMAARQRERPLRGVTWKRWCKQWECISIRRNAISMRISHCIGQLFYYTRAALSLFLSRWPIKTTSLCNLQPHFSRNLHIIYKSKDRHYSRHIRPSLKNNFKLEYLILHFPWEIYYDRV